MSFAHKREWGPVPNYPLVKEYKRPNDDFIIISGSCSVESDYQVNSIARMVKHAGATNLRGGIFRAGTYPKQGAHFGWVNQDLIISFYEAAKSHGLKNIIEVLDYSDESFDKIANFCDVFQVGARSQQNYSLLRKLGQYGKPVFLKRNTGCTVDELLGSAEHLLVGGVKELHLIERGSSTHMNHVRWDLSISAIPAVKSICDIPVIVDASHGTGRRDLVSPMTLAGVAAGAHGVLVESHEDPEMSMSDADQCITPREFQELVKKIHKVREAIA